MAVERIQPGSGPDGRIVAEFDALKKQWDYRNSGLPALWLFLARKHKRPIRDLKALVKRAHGADAVEAEQ